MEYIIGIVQLLPLVITVSAIFYVGLLTLVEKDNSK
jgi:hypothetical protein